MGEYLITGATLVTGSGTRAGGLRVSGEVIAEELPGSIPDAELTRLAERHEAEVIDARGCMLLPGGVDPHVHFSLPVGDLVTADDFVTGGRAALAGGTTSVIDFITPVRGESLVVAAEARLAEASECPCDIALHMSVTGWGPDTASEMHTCVRDFGLRSLKLYLAYLDTIGLDDDGLIPAMETAADLGIPVLLHCEDGAAVARGQRDLLAAGLRESSVHPLSRPPEVEEAAVRHALDLAARTRCQPYIVHVSTAGALAAIAEARERGQTVFVETCPQYLLLDDRAYNGPFERAAPFVMSPPLRALEHLEALGQALEGGQIDVVATDHCSFNLVGQKDVGRHDFTRIPGGAAGVQHRLALMNALMAIRPEISPMDWVRLISEGPARIFGLYPRKGSLDIGADADLVLWDPAVDSEISSETDLHNCDHSIWEGTPVLGEARVVWSRGDLVAERGRVLAEAGRGRFLKR